jgi:hypothetical protein
MRLLAISMLWLGVAHADSSVAKSADPGWCVARYLKELGQRAPTPPPLSRLAPSTVKLGADSVRFQLPAPLVVAVHGELVQVGSGSAGEGDTFGGWEPTLQVRRQTRAELEARIRAIPSDFTGATHAQIEARPATRDGKPAEELCAIVRRTAGHATTTDGVHHAMPDIFELVHGYLLRDGTIGAVYRLPPSALAQLPLWERVLDTLQLR